MYDGLSISVAMCTYNGGKHVGEQLASLLMQEHRPDEVVICDDGSVDDTVSVLHHFQESAPFSVRIVINERPLGAVANFNRAVSLCKADVIFLCDQDDVWYPQKLGVMTAALASNRDVSLVASNNRIVDAAGQPKLGPLNWEACGFDALWQRRVDTGGGFRVLSFHSPLAGHAMAFRKSLTRIICPFPANYHHDRWIALMASALGRVHLISKALNDYRQHGDNLVGSGDADINLLDRARKDPRLCRSRFGHKAEVYEEAKRRLIAFADLPQEKLAWTLGYLDELIAFNRARHDMRSGSNASRFALILVQALRLRYWSCGRGWLTLGRDLVG